MATRKVKLRGPIRWAKVFEENRDLRGFEGAWEEIGGAYTIEMGLDEDNFNKLKEAKSMKQGREEDGLRWVKFDRKHEGKFDWASGPPKVTKKDGTAWILSDDGLIGNDSEAEIVVSVYDTSRKSIFGTRLDRVTVINHVEPVYEEEMWTEPDEDTEELPF